MPLASNSFRFGSFLLDARAAELHTNGTKIKLGEQPFQVLCALLEHPGEVVTREELQQRLWPADTFVDFDHSLNAAVKRLRDVLGDSAEHPIFIETIPKHGYRFVASVEHTLEGIPRGTPPTVLPRRIMPNVLLFTAFLVIAISVSLASWLLSRRNANPQTVSGEPVPAALFHGNGREPTLSPDGEHLAFLSGEGSQRGIYTALVGGENSVQLTNNPGDHFPGWSPDGRQIAFYRFSNQGQAIYTIPALGGTEHRVYQGPSNSWGEGGLDWSPDGETLAFTESNEDRIHCRIALVSLSDFTVRPLTSPDNNHYDWAPSYSPDGSSIAFARSNASGTTSDLFVIPVTGGDPKPITSDVRLKAGHTWSADGKQVIFSAMWAGEAGASLWRVPLSGGAPSPIPGVGTGADAPSVARRGHRLVYQQIFTKQNVWQLHLRDEKHRRGPPAMLVSEKGNKMRPQFSPDGKRIAFESDRLGYWEIWACELGGSDCAQLTSLHGIAGAPQWSPDGRYIAFEFHPHEQSEIYLLDVASGQARLLPTNSGFDNLAPSWSRDSQWLYFGSSRGAGPSRFQLWKISITGGPPLQVTRNGGVRAFESDDGRFLYYVKDHPVESLWKTRTAGGEETIVFSDLHSVWSWAVGENGIYLISFKAHPQGTIKFFDFSLGTLVPIWNLDRGAGWGLTLSPDGDSLAYVQNDVNESNIMLVENFY